MIVAGINNELDTVATNVSGNSTVFNAFIKLLQHRRTSRRPAGSNFQRRIHCRVHRRRIWLQLHCSFRPSALTAVKPLPIGSTSYPAFTVSDLNAVRAAAQTQLANETAVRATKQAHPQSPPWRL